MKNCLKSIGFAVGVIASTTYSSHAARPVVLEYTLTVNGVAKPVIKLNDRDSKLLQKGENIFQIRATQGDASDLLIEYSFKNASKTAFCMISGTPQHLTATIDPESNQCVTQ